MNNKFLLPLAALTSICLLSGCAGDGTAINQDGTVSQLAWHKADTTGLDKDVGTFPNLQSLQLVSQGMTKDQLYALLGRPHYEDGWRPDQWNYLFHFTSSDKSNGEVTTCQYKVVFNKDGFAQSFFWNPVSPEDGKCPPTGEKLSIPSEALFHFNESSLSGLTSDGKEALNAAVDKIKSRKQLENITVVGYTDPLGSDHYNLKLSQRRAETVKDYLVREGISPELIRSVGKGSADQIKICEGKTGTKLKDCLAPNRRVEIIIR